MKKLIFKVLILPFFCFSQAQELDTIVIDSALTKAIRYKQPINTLEKIPNTIKRIYLWTRIKTLYPPTYIYHVWYYKGKEVARIRLYIKYPIFRTWSFKTIPSTWTGKWKVVVEDINGIPLLEREFEVYKKRVSKKKNK
ncbi:MAG: DUF2914 domain-containing protein [Aquificae bacterium]|nr:DUF2914 domain-containing protein [Aquificota bacterium]